MSAAHTGPDRTDARALLCLRLHAPPQHFGMVEDKELAPLSELIEQFMAGKMSSIR
jgi:hypothetical protein